MSGPGDIDGEVSGDEAAWRDLIARFDVPGDTATAGVPWPAREDLPDSAVAADTGPDTAGLEAHSDLQSAAAPDPAAGSDPGARPEPGTRSDAGARAEPGTYSEPGTRSDPGARFDAAASSADPASGSADPAPGPADPAPGSADPGATPDKPRSRTTSYYIPIDRTRVIRPAADPRSYSPPDEQDEPYVPAPLPPPAKLDSASKAALAGVIGGPGYLLVASVFLNWTISAEAAFVAVAAFVGGFVTLVMKLGDRSRRDDDDDGAVL
jgi:hypothetical protein